MALNVIVCIPACRCVYQCSGGVVMYTEQVTTTTPPRKRGLTLQYGGLCD